jgi:hypothetical protein
LTPQDHEEVLSKGVIIIAKKKEEEEKQQQLPSL